MRRFIVLFLGMLVFVSSGYAQDDEGIFPSVYEDCLQPDILEALVQSGPKSWGNPGDTQKANRALEGYFLCSAYTERGEDGCGLLQNMPDDKFAKKRGLECRSEYNVLKFHDALQYNKTEEALRHCSRWCRLYKSEEDKKMVCPNVCRLAIKELKRDRSQACLRTMTQVGKDLGADSEYVEESALLCRMKFTPSSSDCTGALGPANQKDCKGMLGLLKAFARADEKRCPRDAKYAAVCKEMINKKKSMMAAESGESYNETEPSAACKEGAKRFLKPVCDARKASGGMREQPHRSKKRGY